MYPVPLFPERHMVLNPIKIAFTKILQSFVQGPIRKLPMI